MVSERRLVMDHQLMIILRLTVGVSGQMQGSLKANQIRPKLIRNPRIEL